MMSLNLLSAENMAGFYFAIAAFSTVLFILKLLIFSFSGVDSDLHIHETDVGSVEGDPSFTFLSVQSALAFLMGFGWLGLAGIREFGLGMKFSFLLALGVGFFFMYLSARLMYQVKKLNNIPKVDYNDCINKSGKAYNRFAPNGSGQIQIDINGRLATVSAVNASAEEINSFEQIKVVKAENNVLYIEKLNKGE